MSVMKPFATPVMNCDHTARVSLLIDGELSQPEADRIREHVRTCHACWQTLEDFLLLRQEIKTHKFTSDPTTQQQALRKILASNQLAHSPVRRREWLANAFGRPRFSPALTAALVLMGIAITFIVTSYVGSHKDAPVRELVSQTGNSNAVPDIPDISKPATPDTAPERSAEVAPGDNNGGDAVPRSGRSESGRTPPVANKIPRRASEQPKVGDSRRTPQQLVREAEQKYQAAIAMLARGVNRSQIDSTTLAQFDRTLASIDEAIADTRRAVRANPDDPVVVQYMLSAYAKKIEVLEEMTAERRTQ